MNALPPDWENWLLRLRLARVERAWLDLFTALRNRHDDCVEAGFLELGRAISKDTAAAEDLAFARRVLVGMVRRYAQRRAMH